jgi:hypothetical protein
MRNSKVKKFVDIAIEALFVTGAVVIVVVVVVVDVNDESKHVFMRKYSTHILIAILIGCALPIGILSPSP